MPRRDRTTIEETSGQGDSQIGSWIERLDRVKPDLPIRPLAVLRCIFHTAVVIEAGRAPSGRRYEFGPGQVRGDVDPADVVFLLGLVREQHPCCSGGALQPLKFFELA